MITLGASVAGTTLQTPIVPLLTWLTLTIVQVNSNVTLTPEACWVPEPILVNARCTAARAHFTQHITDVNCKAFITY